MDLLRQGSAQVGTERAPLRITVSRSAQRALAARDAPLVVEMELFFSCLVRKRLRWDASGLDRPFMRLDPDHDKLRVWFHPVVSQHCVLPAGDDLDVLPLQDFPLMRQEAFTPRWLRLEYRGGIFGGDFGW